MKTILGFYQCTEKYQIMNAKLFPKWKELITRKFEPKAIIF